MSKLNINNNLNDLEKEPEYYEEIEAQCDKQEEELAYKMRKCIEEDKENYYHGDSDKGIW